MRIVTWNCCRAFSKKASLLESMHPDLTVIQECAKPSTDSANLLWFGDNPGNGLAVQASSRFRLRALPAIADAPKYVIPISVSGPRDFTLFAVWSVSGQQYPYVQAIVKALDMYRDLIDASPTVIAGDFNSNAIWDKEHPNDSNHSALVAKLEKLGLVSAYHHVRKEEHGQEIEPTYFHQWNEKRPFHIDYCFLPQVWADKITAVEIGVNEQWRGHSDHRPLMVDIAE